MLQQAIGLCFVQQCNSNHALCKSWRLEKAGLQNVAMHAAAGCWSCDYDIWAVPARFAFVEGNVLRNAIGMLV